MEQVHYMISDAAKQVQVENHVLRYWEEELELPIQRNKLGHRYYTAEDVNRLKRIKSMKEQGFQLKAIKNALKKELDKSDMQKGVSKEKSETKPEEGKLPAEGKEVKTEKEKHEIHKAETEKKEKQKKETEKREIQKTDAKKQEIKEKNKEEDTVVVEKREIQVVSRNQGPAVKASDNGEKVMRLQLLLKNMMLEAIQEGNEELCDTIKESVLKELDYQFRLQEEREEVRENERSKREEEHYKQIDELLRNKSSRREKRKKHSIF